MLRQLPDVDPQEEVFLREIRFSPEDQQLKEVYADWLEERGDLRAELLRIDLELAHRGTLTPDRETDLKTQRAALHPKLSPNWVAFVSDAAIEKCAPEFAYLCPKRWDALKVLDDDAAIRYCDQCGREVHYCQSIESARSHASKLHCVAIDASVVREQGDLETEFYDTQMILGILDG